ncbi:class I SAM-dependent methyltransferase [Vulcanisaeta thermophila]|uniref:class I SAM-dependent methyltransferase n=1 Tax=Vulcanisaeta thermophila TaxID=867917 RepID=UPI000852EF03|nr:class I SAM-dependent methyltransferase [Vulcanisaeta thermophila]
MPYDVPFVPTPEVVVRRMLQLANVRRDEVVYDLGCGDGRVVIIAAREFGAQSACIEIRKDLYEQTLRRVKDLGLEDRVKVIYGNFFEEDLSDADVVFMYLLTSVNERIRPKLERELRPGTRVVSHDFEMPGWKPLIVEDLYEEWRSHKIYLYKIPGMEVPIPTEGIKNADTLLHDENLISIAKLIDGNRSIEDIALKTGLTNRQVRNMINELIKTGLVKELRLIK